MGRRRHLRHRGKIILVDNALLEARVEKGGLRRRTVLLEGLLHFFLPTGVEPGPRPVLPAQPPAQPASSIKIGRKAARGWTRRHAMAEQHAVCPALGRAGGARTRKTTTSRRFSASCSRVNSFKNKNNFCFQKKNVGTVKRWCCGGAKVLRR